MLQVLQEMCTVIHDFLSNLAETQTVKGFQPNKISRFWPILSHREQNCDTRVLKALYSRQNKNYPVLDNQPINFSIILLNIVEIKKKKKMHYFNLCSCFISYQISDIFINHHYMCGYEDRTCIKQKAFLTFQYLFKCCS